MHTNKPKKDTIVTTNVQKKEFKYAKGAVNLAFVLRTDVDSEMTVFVELMKAAIKDLETEIKKLK